MSYILDALKKSKQERQGEKTPDIHIVHAVPSFKPHSSKSGRNGLLLGGLVILSLGCLYYLFAEYSPSKREDSVTSIIVRELEVRSQFFEQAVEPTVVVQGREFIPVSPGKLREPSKITRKKVKKIVSGVDVTVEAISSESEEMKGVPYREYLSPEIQKNIPSFNFAGHTYAEDPSLRMIIINNQILREGDRVDSDTTLVNIIWEGVVLNYKGILFREKTN